MRLVCTVVGEEGEGCVFLVDDGWGAGDHWGWGFAEAEVANIDDEGEKYEVERRDNWDSRWKVSN